jgi:hypothetical protein
MSVQIIVVVVRTRAARLVGEEVVVGTTSGSLLPDPREVKEYLVSTEQSPVIVIVVKTRSALTRAERILQK